MTESFATATAAVAPVILIASALEVTTYQKAIQEWSASLVQELEPELLPLLDLSPDDRRATLKRLVKDRVESLGPGALRAAVRYWLGYVWAGIVLGQAVVAALCLAWLGDPKHPADPETARLCLDIVVAGALAVAFFPMYRLLSAPLVPVGGRIMEIRMRLRLAEALRTQARQGDEAPTGSNGSAGPATS